MSLPYGYRIDAVKEHPSDDNIMPQRCLPDGTQIVSLPPTQSDAFGRLRISNPVGVSENTNTSSRGRNQWEEPITGVILTYTAISGSFGNGNEIRGLLPVGYIAIGTIITDTAGVSMRLFCNHNDFQIGDTITDQVTGATATVDSASTGADIQHAYERGSVILKVTTTATDSARRHQHKRNSYVAGKSHKVEATFKIGTADDLFLVQRDTISGSLVTTRVHQNDPSKSTDGISTWNSDKLDGTGASGIALDSTKAQIFDMDLQLLKVGRVRMNFNIDGVTIKAHEFLHANKITSAYMRNPSQPVQFSIHNDGTYTYKRVGYFQNADGLYFEARGLTTSSDLELEEICCAVESEGGHVLPGFEYSTPISWADERAVTTARTILIAVRLKNNFPTGKPNERVAKVLDFGASARTNDVLLELVHLHEPFDITGATWIGIGESGLEFSTDITSVTGRPAHVLDMDIFNAGSGQTVESKVVSADAINLHGFISQSTNSDNSQMFAVYGSTRTGTANVLPHLTMLVSD